MTPTSLSTGADSSSMKPRRAITPNPGAADYDDYDEDGNYKYGQTG